jgi:hypothetical protein
MQILPQINSAFFINLWYNIKNRLLCAAPARRTKGPAEFYGYRHIEKKSVKVFTDSRNTEMFKVLSDEGFKFVK